MVTIGNALVDVLASASDDDLARLGLVKGTMALVDHERSQAIYEAMGPTTEASGGSAANTAAGIAALGGRVAHLGRVADDALGQAFIHDIRSVGVALRPDAGAGRPGRSTGHCLVLVTEDAERTMATHLGVASDFSSIDLHDGHLTRRPRSCISRAICGSSRRPRRPCGRPSRWPMPTTPPWPSPCPTRSASSTTSGSSSIS